MVREQTLKSVLLLITKLSDRIINGELLRQLARTANDEQPGIRTNTTICLGKIAKYLGSASRSKVLIAAFTRSLRDPFVHARNAALLALAATTEHFSDEDCATRILPVVCPLLIDKERMIRDQANRTIDSYLQKVRKAASEMPDTALTPQQQTADGQPARMGTPQQTASAGWTGWAISSFTNKLSTAAGDMQTANGASGTSTPKPSPSPGPEISNRLPSASASSLHRKAVTSPPPTASEISSPSGASALADAFFQDDGFDDEVGDAWGEMNEDDEMIQPAVTSQTKNKASAMAVPFADDSSEPDFAGWLEAQAQKKKPGSLSKPLPKGLSKTTTTAKRAITTKPPAKTAAKPAVVKKIDMKPKDVDDDDAWGDGW